METDYNNCKSRYVFDAKLSKIIVDTFVDNSSIKLDDKVIQLEDRVSCLENMVKELIAEVRGR